MRRCLTPLLWLALTATALGAVTITGPTEPVPVDRFVVLPIAGAEVVPQVLVWPKTATALVDISHGDLYVVFQAERPGTYEVTVIASPARVIPGEAYARCLILVGEDQPPPPPPPPPPPTKPRYIWLIHESDTVASKVDPIVARDRAKVRMAIAWKQEAGKLGMDFLVADDDDLERVAPEAVKAARDLGLPAVVFLDDDKAVLSAIPMPATPNEMLATVKKYGSATTEDQGASTGQKGPSKPVEVSQPDCPTCPPKKPAAPRPQPTRWRLFPGRR